MQRDFGVEPPPRTTCALGAGRTLDLDRRELVGADGLPIELRAQALRVLLVLGERAGAVVGKDELMRRVWGDVVVTEDSLVQAVGDIRRALGDDGHRRVRTVPRRGYMLLADGPAAPAAVPEVALADAARAASPRQPAHRWPAALGVALLLVAIGGAAWAAWTVWPRDTAPPRSLAILPFETEQGSDGWFVDGVSTDLGAIVATWSGVKVIGRGTTAVYRGRDVDPRIVGRELGVRHVLSGRARREGDRVRLAVTLVEAASRRIVWSELRDVPRAELPALVGDVAGGIARTLTVEYGDVVAAAARTLAPHQVQADDLAMQGFAELLRSVSREAWERARTTFEAAVAIDPDCPRCLGGLSLANTNLVLWEWADDREAAIARAEHALERLELLAPDRSITLMARASLAHVRRDWPGVLAIGDRLAAQFPNEPTSHHHRCSALLRLARFDESIAACERAQRISPRDSRVSVWQGLIGFNQFHLGRHAQAEQSLRASVLANPRVPIYGVVLAAALAEQGRRDEALQVARETTARHPTYRVATLASFWVGEPRFMVGRDRLVVLAGELGVPP